MQPITGEHINHHRYKFVPYIGLYVFGIGSVISTLFEFVAEVSCSSLYQHIIKNVETGFSSVSEKLTAMIKNGEVFCVLSTLKFISVLLQVCGLIYTNTSSKFISMYYWWCTNNVYGFLLCKHIQVLYKPVSIKFGELRKVGNDLC